MPYGSNTRALELTPLRSVQKVCATRFKGTLFGGPYKKDSRILGSMLGSPYFGKVLSA